MYFVKSNISGIDVVSGLFRIVYKLYLFIYADKFSWNDEPVQTAVDVHT